VHLNGPAGQTVVGIVSVRAGEERPLRIEESSFDIKTKVTYAIEEVEAGRFFRIRFTAIPGPPGTFRGVLSLKTNYPEKPQIVIPIMTRLHGAGKAQREKGKQCDALIVLGIVSPGDHDFLIKELFEVKQIDALGQI